MNISSDTIGRTVVLIIALVNQVLAIFGKPILNIAENDIYQVISILFTIGATVCAWWKNNSFTHAAILGDKVTKNLKEGNITSATVNRTLVRCGKED